MTASLTFPVLQLDQLLPALAAHCAADGGPLPAFSTSPNRPHAPGVYVWCDPSTSTVLYVGSAAQLSRRLGDEERWIRSHEPATGWAPSVIHFLHQRAATASWISTSTHADARLLERRLVEWHRAVIGCAPLLTGWDPKPGSEQAAAVEWARDLWKQDSDTYRGWDAVSHPVGVPA